MGASAQITQEVGAWPGIATAPHRFGGVEFLLGKAEIGHLHGDALLDIAFTRAIRDVLIGQGKASPHHVAPESGWISFRLRVPEDTDQAIWLLRLSYMRHILLIRRKPHGAEMAPDVDVEEIMLGLAPGDELESILANRMPPKGN